MSRCRSCGAEIRWIKTFSGKQMPVDAEPVRFFPDGEGRDMFVMKHGAVVSGTRAGIDDDHTYVGFISHFATCPNADKHRKRG